ncbi:two-component sensor histidine kinase, partial [Kitasatospora sp. NPDC085895]
MTGPRALPAWCTATWLMLLLPVLISLVDAALVSKGAKWWEAALSVLAALALLLRRRLPVAVLLLTLPGAFVNYIWLAPMTAVYTVAAQRAA